MDNVVFPPIYFYEPGVYEFTIRELSPSRRCWSTDRTVYRAVVTVEELNGKLKARVDYPDGNPCFCNVYTCCCLGPCCCHATHGKPTAK